MNWIITIGQYRLTMLDSVEVTRSVEKLSDTAVIVLPGSCFNRAIEVEDLIKRSDEVIIQLGYNNKLENEFEGYLDRISTDDGSIRLHCEDSLFLLKKAVPDKELKNPDVSDILKYILAGSNITLECDYSFKYDKYIIKGETAYQVLKKIQEETKANIYLKGNVLHVHPQYSQIFGQAVYSFQENIESSDLEYMKSEDRKVEVTVEGKGIDGKVIREVVGEKGGDSVTIKINGVSDRATLRNLANEQLKVKSYTGYSGSFTGWLIPFCDAGYKVSLSDVDYEYKSGDYYALEVVVKFSSSGGSRIVKIGKKL
ncbi:MAG: hypothetical protein KGZ81_09715 [Flavobacteriales bacterium]|nr:hypothetical protein [Flavobacteriales bacterium]